ILEKLGEISKEAAIEFIVNSKSVPTQSTIVPFPVSSYNQQQHESILKVNEKLQTFSNEPLDNSTKFTKNVESSSENSN
ncbi:3738_t:CDS:1, partial [Gigaspora rosea]